MSLKRTSGKLRWPLLAMSVLFIAFVQKSSLLAASSGQAPPLETISASTEKGDVPPKNAGNAPVTSAVLINASARQALNRTCSVLASAKKMTYHAEVTFDSVLPSYVKLQYAGAMDVAVEWPDHPAISSKSYLGAEAIWYNGETLTLFDPAHDVYTSLSVQGSLDEMLVKVAKRNNLSMPLAPLDFNDPCGNAYSHIQHGKYVGLNDVSGVTCDHLAFTQADLDWQIWIAHSGKPLPEKIVIIYKEIPV